MSFSSFGRLHADRQKPRGVAKKLAFTISMHQPWQIANHSSGRRNQQDLHWPESPSTSPKTKQKTIYAVNSDTIEQKTHKNKLDKQTISQNVPQTRFRHTNDVFCTYHTRYRYLTQYCSKITPWTCQYQILSPKILHWQRKRCPKEAASNGSRWIWSILLCLDIACVYCISTYHECTQKCMI